MKKLIAFLFVCGFALTFVACGGAKTEEAASEEPAVEETTPAEEPAAETPADSTEVAADTTASE